MQGKQINSGNIENALNQFLQDEHHLVLGFEKGEDGVNHKIFKNSLQHFSLFNPVFSINGALYLRRLFSKASQIILMLRPCEIRAYSELTKLTQIEREGITAVSIDCFGAVSSKEKTEDIPTEMDQLKDYFKDSEQDALGLSVLQRKKRGCGRCRCQDRQERHALGSSLYGKG